MQRLLRFMPRWFIVYISMMVSLGTLIVMTMLVLGFMQQRPSQSDAIIALEQEAGPTMPIAPPTHTPTATREAVAIAQANNAAPTNTLRPPPTFEPPTNTPPPSNTPQPSPTFTLQLDFDLAGIVGLESPTPSTTPGCQKTRDWHLEYEVQTNETLTMIAERFGTNIWEMQRANCLTDPNVIRVGQKLLVPGDAFPQEPKYDCSTPYEALTPIDNAGFIPGTGQISFNWRGPQTFRQLVRIVTPDGDELDYVVDLRQNLTVDAADIPEEGHYQWYIIPLDENYVEACLRGGPYRFHKEPAPHLIN